MKSDNKPEIHSLKKKEATTNTTNIKIKGKTYAQNTAFKPSSLFNITSTVSFNWNDWVLLITSISLSLESETPQADFALHPSQLILPFKEIVIVSCEILVTIPSCLTAGSLISKLLFDISTWPVPLARSSRSALDSNVDT